MKKIILFGVLIIAVMVFVGCGEKIAEKAIEKGTGVDLDNNKITINDSSGNTFTQKNSEELPSDYPENAPYYESGNLTSTSVLDFQDEKSYFLLIKTSDEIDSIISYYKEKLAAESWTIVLESQTDFNSQILAEKDSMTLSMSILEMDEDGLTINHTVNIKISE